MSESALREPIASSSPEAPRKEPVARGTSEQFFLLLSIFIGVFAGLAVVCFRITIEFARTELLGTQLIPTTRRLFLAPTLTGFVVAVLVIFLFPRVRGSGVNQTKAALYIYDGYIPFRTAIGKFICSALAIGSGQSLGPEDPSLQIGASIASAVGRRLELGREKLRLIAPIGAAAGLAAAFNSPISAVLFVIEEVIGRWTASIFGAVVLAAISSVTVSRYFLGSEPLFRIPPVSFIRPGELLAYAILGIVGAFASVVFSRAIQVLRPRMKQLPRWTQFVQPAAAGFIIGTIGYLGYPQVMGAGYEYMDQALHDQFAWKVLAILAGLKILATVCSFVSGTPGGMFAPTLFIGGMLGGAVGGVERLLVPHITTGSVATYALVGMGVLFAGFLRAPMTSVFMVLEISGNYSIIVPVILANTLAYLIARNLQPVPIFDLLTRQDGLVLPSMEEEREERLLRVEDAMHDLNIPVLPPDTSIADALIALDGAKHLLVTGQDGGWHYVDPSHLTKVASAGQRDLPLSQVAVARLPQLFPDHRLEVALRYVTRWPVLPVVHRADPTQLVGVVTLEDMLRRYVIEGQVLTPEAAEKESTP